MFADLHLHTTASDGNLKPREVVARAKKAGFAVIAITDHDSLDGLEEAMWAAEEYGIEVIPGLELSALDGDQEIHFLGYFINMHDERLKTTLTAIVNDRELRAERMIEKLNEIGCEIRSERVRKIAGSEFIGRPHIAKALVEKGYIDDLAEAFTEAYIGRNGRAYVERFRINPSQAIELIKNAGGLAVLAHPGYLSDRSTLGEEDIRRYKKMGLDGIEVYYSRHTPNQVDLYKGIALKLKLLITGGSDCHGSDNGLMGCVKMSCKHVEALKNARV